MKPMGPIETNLAPSSSPSSATPAASTGVNLEYVERCQKEYLRDPRSRIFAPLAEAYRKMDLLEEALRVCESGVSFHPDFAGGRVAYAKCLIDKRDLDSALTQLERAAEISPDNLLCHSLMGETLLALRRPKDALKAFKMALFLNPNDVRAREAVRKWEFLTAEEYDAEVFFEVGAGASHDSVSTHGTNTRPRDGQAPDLQSQDRIVARPPIAPPVHLERELERALSLADAFTVRHNIDSATQVLMTARARLGNLPEIENRLAALARRSETPEPIRPIGAEKPTPFQTAPNELELTVLEDEMTAPDAGFEPPAPAHGRARQALEAWLHRIAQRRSPV